MPEESAIDIIAVDTGVWLEGLLFGGAAEELFKMAMAEQIRLLTCEALLLELLALLRDRLDFSQGGALAVERFVRECAQVAEDPRLPAAGVPDRRSLVVALAREHGATLIAATERSRLHRVSATSEIPIVAIA